MWLNACLGVSVSSGESSVKKKRKRGDSARVESEEDGEKKKKKDTARPNYFVSVPITNPEVRAGDSDRLTLTAASLSEVLLTINNISIRIIR